jgi:hypothetical protein
MTYIQNNKTTVAFSLLILISLLASLYTLTQVSKTKSAIEELATVLGQSRIVTQQDGKLIVNRVVTIADVQAIQGQP